MLFVSTLPVVALFLSIISAILALPTSRFDHTVQTLSTRDSHKHVHRAINITPERTHRLRKRGLPGAVYICTADNFRGDCAWTPPDDDCHIAGTGDSAARSIGPDENGFCVLFENATCKGKQIKTLRFPGQAAELPAFMSLQCFADGGSNVGANATALAVGTFSKNDADPRLAGGVGSMERKKLESEMERMEKDGFAQGIIGLKKGHYY